MKKLILGILAVLLSVLAQTVLLPRLLPLSWRPDVYVAGIVAAALTGGLLRAGAYALCCGLISDVLLGAFVGAEAMACFLTALLVGAVYEKPFAKSWAFAAGAAFVARVAKEVVYVLVLELFGIETSFFSVLFTALLPSALLTAALCLPLWFLCRRGAARGAVRHRAHYD